MNPYFESAKTTVMFRLNDKAVLHVTMDGDYDDIDYAEYVALKLLEGIPVTGMDFVSCKTEYLSYR